MKRIPEKSFDLVIADPPYKQEAHNRGKLSGTKIYAEMADYTSLKNEWYSERVLEEFVRICKYPNVFVFGGKRDVIDILMFAESRNLNYWILPICKTNPAPFTNNTWLSGEFAVHITDRKIIKTDNYKLKIPYFLTSGGKKVTQHPNEKNEKDIMKIILNLTSRGESVFDPFSGSATVAACCLKLKRNFLGVEKKKEYFEIGNKRIESIRRKGVSEKDCELEELRVKNGGNQGFLI